MAQENQITDYERWRIAYGDTIRLLRSLGESLDQELVDRKWEYAGRKDMDDMDDVASLFYEADNRLLDTIEMLQKRRYNIKARPEDRHDILKAFCDIDKVQATLYDLLEPDEDSPAPESNGKPADRSPERTEGEAGGVALMEEAAEQETPRPRKRKKSKRSCELSAIQEEQVREAIDQIETYIFDAAPMLRVNIEYTEVSDAKGAESRRAQAKPQENGNPQPLEHFEHASQRFALATPKTEVWDPDITLHRNLSSELAA